jgi:hypothetical protein
MWYLRNEISKYSASTCKLLIDIGDLFTASLGRIFCSAKNRAFRGFRRLRGRWPPAVAPPLQSLAHEPVSPSAMRMDGQSP